MPIQTITKREIAQRISLKSNINQVLALEVIQSFLDGLVEELAKGNRIEFRDFGVFSPVTRKPRTALNPKTLEKVYVNARTVVKFKTGRLLKERVEKLIAQNPDLSPSPSSDPGLSTQK